LLLLGDVNLTALVGLAANGALLLGCYWIALYGLKRPRGLDVALAAAVLFWTACTVGLELQSALGLIGSGAIAVEAALVLAAGGIWRLSRPHVDPEPAAFGNSTGAHRDALAALALVLWAGMVLAVRSLLLAVKVVSDGPIYHLYFAARWWKAGRLILVAAPFGESAATYFPANGDLVFTWLMASWGGDRLAKIGQAPFLVLAGLAAYGCARVLGASRSASIVATCWFASSTPFLIYSFEPNVDTIFVAGYMLATYFFLRAVRGAPSTAAVCLGALAAGLALGTKPVGVVFVPPLVALFLGAILFQTAPPRIRLVRVLLAGLLPLVTGGYWYVRNALLTGNPVYPLEIRAFGRVLLGGWYTSHAMRHSPYYVPLADWRALCDILLAVLDPRLAPFWIGALALALARGSRTDSTWTRWVGIVSLLAILNIALYWVCIPYRSQQRFMLQALGLAVVPLATLLDHARWLRRGAVILLAFHLLTPQTWPLAKDENAIPWDFTRSIPNAVDAPTPLFARLDQLSKSLALPGAILNVATLLAVGLAAALVVWAWRRVERNSPRLKQDVTAAVAAIALFVGLGVADLWSLGFDSRVRFYPPFRDFYRGWLNFAVWAGQKGSRVAYAGTDLPYYLLGEHLRNEVRYINIDRHGDWLMHDYHRAACEQGAGNWPGTRPGWDRMGPDFQAWLENLAAERIQLLVVTRVNPDEGLHNVADSEGFPIERGWAESHRAWFEPVYGLEERDPWFRLFRVRRPGAGRN
jgi:hypothetical protein